jgi:hypothetical protein
LCTFCSLSEQVITLAAMRFGGLGREPFPFVCFFGGLCFHIHYKVTECLLKIVLVAVIKPIQLSATDLLALPSMKNAAKCDK